MDSLYIVSRSESPVSIRVLKDLSNEGKPSGKKKCRAQFITFLRDPLQLSNAVGEGKSMAQINTVLHVFV